MQDQFLCILCMFCIPITTNLLGASAKQDICPFYEDGIRTAAKNYWQNLFLPFLFLFPNVSNKYFIFSVPCVVHVNEELQKRYLFFSLLPLLWTATEKNAKFKESQKNWCQFRPWDIYGYIFSLFYFSPSGFNTLFFYAAYRHCDVF